MAESQIVEHQNIGVLLEGTRAITFAHLFDAWGMWGSPFRLMGWGYLPSTAPVGAGFAGCRIRTSENAYF
jgi:hypothetical protein